MKTEEMLLLSDEELIVLYQKGIKGAIDILINRYAAFLLSYCLKYCKDEDDVKDACQNVWINVLAAFLQVKGGYKEMGKFKEWLRMMAFRYFSNLPKPPIFMDVDTLDKEDKAQYEQSDEETECDVIAREFLAAYDHLIPELPARYQLLIELRIIRELSFLEMVVEIGGTVEALRTEYSRMVKVLKEMLN